MCLFCLSDERFIIIQFHNRTGNTIMQTFSWTENIKKHKQDILEMYLLY